MHHLLLGRDPGDVVLPDDLQEIALDGKLQGLAKVALRHDIVTHPVEVFRGEPLVSSDKSYELGYMLRLVDDPDALEDPDH